MRDILFRTQVSTSVVTEMESARFDSEPCRVLTFATAKLELSIPSQISCKRDGDVTILRQYVLLKPAFFNTYVFPLAGSPTVTIAIFPE